MNVIAIAGRRYGRTTGAIISKIAKRLFAVLKRSRQRRPLTTLSDNLLHDVGLTRSEFRHQTVMIYRQR